MPVSLVSLAWSSPDLVSNTPGYLLCFSNADIQLNTAVVVSMTAAHVFPLDFCMTSQAPQTEVPSPSYSETQRWVSLFFFLYK